MLEELTIPEWPHPDRLIGFTIPRNGAFYVCDHDEVWRVTFAPSPRIELTDLAPYAFVEGNRDFLGLVFDGERENLPLLISGQNEIGYAFSPKNGSVVVRHRINDQQGQTDFPTFSGDWFVASLSDDGRYVVMAEPYRLSLFRTS